MVDNYHTYLATVISVYGSWAIYQANTVFGCKP